MILKKVSSIYLDPPKGVFWRFFNIQKPPINTPWRVPAHCNVYLVKAVCFDLTSWGLPRAIKEDRLPRLPVRQNNKLKKTLPCSSFYKMTSDCCVAQKQKKQLTKDPETKTPSFPLFFKQVLLQRAQIASARLEKIYGTCTLETISSLLSSKECSSSLGGGGSG